MSLPGHVFSAPDGVRGFDTTESVAPNTAVAFRRAGYVPGVYVGYRAGLTPIGLYRSLKFTHYWGAYNLNVDQYPAVRGIQMKQSKARSSDRPEGTTIDFQTDRVRGDSLGGRPTLL